MAPSTGDDNGQPASRGLEFFDAADALDLVGSGTMSVPECVDPDISLDMMVEFGTSAGHVVKVLYRGDDGFSLVWSHFGPHYMLPRHSHSADCLYYVVRGEARLGNRVVHAGSGFFVPGDAPYAYAAGPDGIEILEFRHERTFDMVITDSAARFEKILENAREHGQSWAASVSAHG